MKKLVVVGVVVLGIAGAGALAFKTMSNPVPTTCSRIVALCELDAEAEAQCDVDLQALVDQGGERTDKLHTCVADAGSCSEATGCYTGTSLKVLAGEVGDFFKGVGNAFKR